MPFKIKETKVGNQPIAICEVCGKEIRRAEDATVAFIPDDFTVSEEGTMFDIFTVHKDRACFDRFEDGRGIVSDIPLPAFMVYLGHNLNLKREEAEQQAALLA